MRHIRLGLVVVLFFAGVWLAPLAAAQETKSARGTVTAVGPNSITVKAGTAEMKFAVDPKTVLTAIGAGTAARRAEAAGKPGPQLADFVKAGDPVEVHYQETAGVLRASTINRITSAGPGGGSTSDTRPETTDGTVASISGSTLTISGSAPAGGSFTQAFSIDGSTQVVAVGASTAAGKGGKVVITDFVGVGDAVTVIYRKMGTQLHADEVRVRSRKK